MNKLYGMIGLCARAGRLVTGENAVIKLIRSGKAGIVFLDGSTAPNGKKAITDACNHYNVRLAILPEGAIGTYSGKSGRMSAATADESFANRMIEIYDKLSGVD